MRQIHMSLTICKIIFAFLFLNIIQISEQANESSQSIIRSQNFLRSNLIPEYIKGAIYTYASDFSELGPECRLHFVTWLHQLRENYGDLRLAENWALKMVDSWGKAPEGVLSGHINSMGDFDECLSVFKDSSELSFKGKYCTVNILSKSLGSNETENVQNVNKSHEEDIRSISQLMALLKALSKSEHPISPTVASCLPSSCGLPDIQLILDFIFNSSDLTDSMRPMVGKCYTNEKPPLGTGPIVMIVILGILAALCVTGSILDLLHRYEYIFQNTVEENSSSKMATWVQLLFAFSLPKNTQKLLVTKSQPNSYECLHGIRFLSAVWVVLGHTFFMYILNPTWNIVDVAEAPLKSLVTLLIVNGGVVVDTFLTITGILVASNLLRQLDIRNGRVNILMIYLNRYLRLTPMYALLIGVSSTIFPYMGSGPKWYVVEMWSQFCQRNWWHNLLYVNNLDLYAPNDSPSTNKQCFGEAWYLAVDMQLFLISPLLIYPLWKWRRVGPSLLSFVTLISIIVPAAITYANNLPPTALPFIEKGKFTQESYMAPWMRASPYIMGLWTGVFLHKTRGRGGQNYFSGFRLPRLVVLSFWAVTSCSAAAVVLGIQKYFDWRNKVPRVEGSIYSGLYHGIWGLSIGWMVFACCRGCGGWVNRFLSWRVFIPLGRLSYAVYLVSLNLQFLLHFRNRQPLYYDMYSAINLAFSHICMSLLIAFIVSLTMEAPFMEIEKILFRKKKERDDEGLERTKVISINGNENDHRNYGTN